MKIHYSPIKKPPLVWITFSLSIRSSFLEDSLYNFEQILQEISLIQKKIRENRKKTWRRRLLRSKLTTGRPAFYLTILYMTQQQTSKSERMTNSYLDSLRAWHSNRLRRASAWRTGGKSQLTDSSLSLPSLWHWTSFGSKWAGLRRNNSLHFPLLLASEKFTISAKIMAKYRQSLRVQGGRTSNQI